MCAGSAYVRTDMTHRFLVVTRSSDRRRRRGLAVGGGIIRGQSADIIVAGQPVEIAVSSVSPVDRAHHGPAVAERRRRAGAGDGRARRDEFGAALARARTRRRSRSARGQLIVRSRRIRRRAVHGRRRRRFTSRAPARAVQRSRSTGRARHVVPARRTARCSASAKADRSSIARASTDPMRNGQGGYSSRHNGTRAPIQWLIGTRTAGRCSSISRTGSSTSPVDVGKFLPAAEGRAAARRWRTCRVSPLDLFVVGVARAGGDHARVRAHHRASPRCPRAGRSAISSRTARSAARRRSSASRARSARRSCRATRSSISAPSSRRRAGTRATASSPGIPTNFPDPKKMLDALHADHFKVVVHVVIEGRRLTGTVDRSVHGRAAAERTHAGRPLAARSPGVVLLAGPQSRDGRRRRRLVARPGRRLRRTVAAQPASHVLGGHAAATGRTSGRSRCTATRRPACSATADSSGRATSSRDGRRCKTHVPVAVNTGLSGLPYWGTDIGGFNPDGGIHRRAARAVVPVRRVQSAVPLARTQLASALCRGAGTAATADRSSRATSACRPDELHNAQVEPICRKYLELRYRLMPYLYTAVRECHETGLPIMRALWLHYPDDSDRGRARRRVSLGPRHAGRAGRREGRDDAARSICRKARGSTSGRTSASKAAARSIAPVDLATMPLYVRAGAVHSDGPGQAVHRRAQRRAD